MMWQFGMFARLWTHRWSGWMQRKFGAGMFFTLSLVILLLTYIIYCRCIEHSIHLMACHFVTALNVPGIGRTKKKIHAPGSAQQDLADEFEESFDVDISIDVEALPDDAEAMHAAFDISFEPGDIVGKLLAFIAQVRACSDDVREYLLQIATSLGCPSWEIKLWVRTRWGSLSVTSPVLSWCCTPTYASPLSPPSLSVLTGPLYHIYRTNFGRCRDLDA
jgi:hypothetical protein